MGRKVSINLAANSEVVERLTQLARRVGVSGIAGLFRKALAIIDTLQDLRDEGYDEFTAKRSGDGEEAILGLDNVTRPMVTLVEQ